MPLVTPFLGQAMPLGLKGLALDIIPLEGRLWPVPSYTPI